MNTSSDVSDGALETSLSIQVYHKQRDLYKIHASEFVKEYIALCHKYGGEVVVNGFGVHTVQFDDGKVFSFASVYPDWNTDIADLMGEMVPYDQPL